MFVRPYDFVTLKRAFVRNDTGSMAALMALVLAVVMLSAGGAIDFLRWNKAHRQTKSAIDAAVLAGGRSLIISPGDTRAAVAVATKVYELQTAGRAPLASDSIHFLVDPTNGIVSAAGSANISTTILRAVGMEQLGVITDAGSGSAKAMVTPGGPGGSNLEVAVMLDVTGSMCADGAGPCTDDPKLKGLKDAATELVNIVVQDDQSTFTSRVALVPFATQI